MEKNCGLIECVDQMGKVQIPREIRKLLNILEGQKVTISADNNKIIIEKYMPMQSLCNWQEIIISALSSVIEHEIILTDDKQVLYSNKKKYINKELSNEAIELIFKREVVIKKEDSNMVNIFVNLDCDFCCELVVPIIKDNDILGSIMVLAEKNKCFNDDTIKVCKAFASFLTCVIV